MGALSPTHWLIIVGVLVLLFGAKRLPDAARSLGRSARILKSEVKELHPDEPAPTAPPAPAAELPAPAAQPAATQPAATQPAATQPAATQPSVKGDQPR